MYNTDPEYLSEAIVEPLCNIEQIQDNLIPLAPFSAWPSQS